MELSEFFTSHNKAALAFSGGVDSSYLLCAAIKYGADIHAYYVKSEFQPRFELDDARRLAEELGAKLDIIEADVLSVPEITRNPKNRCYYCKKQIFSTISARARHDGYTVILDGTNASDDVGDRPGMKALAELSVLSPLRECGLTKDEIRRRSREAGLFTWNKPAYACLATRIPSGEEITHEKLTATERAEDYLFSLGFTDFRVRMQGGAAKLQLHAEQYPALLGRRAEILCELKKYYTSVMLDLEARN
ncbi:MAG: ATP-dependent sacrificial sulfur transferase LarE [Eubacteriales bacterium]